MQWVRLAGGIISPFASTAGYFALSRALKWLKRRRGATAREEAPQQKRNRFLRRKREHVGGNERRSIHGHFSRVRSRRNLRQLVHRDKKSLFRGGPLMHVLFRRCERQTDEEKKRDEREGLGGSGINRKSVGENCWDLALTSLTICPLPVAAVVVTTFCH